MRGIHLLFATLVLFLLSFAQSQSPTSIDFFIGQSQAPEPSSSDSTTSSADALSSSSPSSSTQTTLMTNTIAVSSFLTASTASAVSQTGNVELVQTTTASSSAAASTTASSSTSGLSRQNLIIILACVLGTVAVALIALLVWLLLRQRRKRSLVGRGVSPIDDEEIESWRRSAQEKKHAYIHDNGGGAFDKEIGARSTMDSNTIQIAPSPGWTWTASPTSTRSPYYPSGVSSNIPDTPRFFAQTFAHAPNARVGLTDETIPGAEPFIKPVKRQSSRLSKSSPHHHHHSRTKSRRSSISGKSMWSLKSAHAELKANDRVATWYDPEDDFRVARDFTDSPATSIREGTPGPVTALAPRPPTRPLFWDRDSRHNSFWDRDPEIGEIGLAIS